jgi:hypothetical protein
VHLTAPGPATVTSAPSPVPGPEAVETDPVAHGALPGTTSRCRVMNTTNRPWRRRLDLVTGSGSAIPFHDARNTPQAGFLDHGAA